MTFSSRLGCPRIFSLTVAVAFLLSAAFAGESQAPADKSLFERVLELNRIQEPELDLPATRKAFDDIVGKARDALAGANTPREKITALNRILLGDRQVSYLSNKYWRDATLAASLLRGKGNCLSTSTLYVVAGAALSLPIHMVLIQGHAFVRWDDGVSRINIETTAGGREKSNLDYANELELGYTSEDAAALGWPASLDTNEFYAELLSTSAAYCVGENNLEAALNLYEQAQKLTPKKRDDGLFIALIRLELMANVTGRRTEAREKILAMVDSRKSLPYGVMTMALEFLASDAAGSGDHEAEHRYLLEAFAHAPKSSQGSVLERLAFCHRALKDFRGAVRYMELAVVLVPPGSPELATILYDLAILQKNDGRLGDALTSIRHALTINPESWNLRMIEAGYMVLNKEREAGLKKFAAIERPRGDVEFFNIMTAWFDAVSRQREKFYSDFENALTQSRSTHILEWIDQDVDLDVYRNEPEFKALVEKHAARLRGK